MADRCQGVLGSWATTTGAWPPSADGDVSFNLVSWQIPTIFQLEKNRKQHG